jgi:glycine/D-amino acid oxidase-like deaminating enzyme
MGAKIAVAGAGIYGATAAIRLAERGHQVTLFDPLGVMRAVSASISIAFTPAIITRAVRKPSPRRWRRGGNLFRHLRRRSFKTAAIITPFREKARARIPRNTSRSCAHMDFPCMLVVRSG